MVSCLPAGTMFFLAHFSSHLLHVKLQKSVQGFSDIWVNMKAAASTQLGVIQTSGALLLNFLLDTLFDYCLTAV